MLSLTAETHNILLLSTFFIWFAAIGYPLRSSGELADEGDPKWPRLAPLQLPLLLMACVLTLILWEKSALYLHYGATEPSWSWLVDIAMVPGPVAIACGFGLWRFGGLDCRRAVMAGAAIFVLQYASGAVLIAILQSHGVPRLTAYDWWGVTSFAPCALLVLALFEPSFRKIAVWAPLAILFAAPSALSIWLKAHAPGAIPDAAVGLLSLAVFSLWIAAIGYQLQRAHPKQATSGDGHDGEDRGRIAGAPLPAVNTSSAKFAGTAASGG